MTLSLAELRDALAALGISTTTDGLRGEERRLELVVRLQQAQTRPNPRQSASKATARIGEEDEGEEDGDPHHASSPSRQIGRYQHMALGELRRLLEERGQSTQTPGLKGDARRHALVQRLVNTHSSALQQHQVAPAGADFSSHLRDDLSGRRSEDGAGGGNDDADTKSVSSSSSYSTATEFFFFDLPSGRTTVSSDGAKDELHFQHRMPVRVPTLELHGGCRLNEAASGFFPVSMSTPQEADAGGDHHDSQRLHSELHDELFEKRKQLHQLREQRHRSVEERMRGAGFNDTLESLSRQLESIESERRRLMKSYFAHELVTVPKHILAPTSTSHPLELVQEDAVRLLEKRQETLQRQVEQTREAVEITKRALNDDDDSHTAAGRNKEAELLDRIQQINELLLQQARDSARSLESRIPSWRSATPIASSSPVDTTKQELPVLLRCRSMSGAMFKQTWSDLEPEQKQQLCHELRAAASFRIKRDRVSLGGHFGSLTSRSPPTTTLDGGAGSPATGTASGVPSQADRLGVKALFLELTRRGALETSRAYQQAIALDGTHATNLGNYARFLFLVCGQLDMAQEHFQLALRADPMHAQNLANYANFLKRARHDMDQAEKYYQQALRLAPNDVNVMSNYANLLAKRSDPVHKRRAKELLELALRITPSHMKTRLQYAAVLTAVGDFVGAEQCYEQLIKSVELQERSRAADSAKEHNPVLSDDQVQQHKDENSGAVNALDKEHAHVFGNYANFLRRRGRPASAKQMYAKALALHPTHPLLLRNLCVPSCLELLQQYLLYIALVHLETDRECFM